VGAGTNSYATLKYFNIFFFSFRMPLFFIVSGIFLGGSLARKGFGKYVTDRFHTIFYPLLIWGILQITLQLIFAGYVNAERYPMDYLNLVINPRRIEQFWYLNALFFVSVLYALIRWYARFKPLQQLLLGLFLYSVAAYCHIHKFHIGFLIDVFFFYIFFAIGDAISDVFLHDKNYKFLTSFRTLLLILPAFVALQHYFTRLNLAYGDDYYVQFYRPEIYIMTALIGCAFIINLSFVLQRLNIFRFLRVIGYHSLYIYVMHLMIAAGVRIVLVEIFNVENIPLLMIVCISLGVIVPVIAFNLSALVGLQWLFVFRKKREIPPKPSQHSLYFNSGMVSPKESVPGNK
jgi:fucose 4-O-acetylase-like acetyltransferase